MALHCLHGEIQTGARMLLMLRYPPGTDSPLCYDSESVIHCAARHGHVNIAKLFLEHKVDVNIGDCTK